ncbi:MAG: hypothetical protein IPM63_17310 [Acidobacteriota bacterium]|nr:MAG: hypothetical protein IPM63_17310 [Acidobacteriota bacterium]
MRPKAAILLFAFFLAVSCSVPNLESESCVDARGELKKLYSLHFDRGRASDEQYRRDRERFLTEDLAQRIDENGEIDYLTQTGDFPKAFRIGKCTETGKDTLSFGVLLFWRDVNRDEQREIEASMEKTDGGWVLDKVEKGEE